MMKSFEQQLRGEYLGQASGGKLYRFINALHQKNLECRRQRCQGDTYCFLIVEAKRSQAEKIAKQYGAAIQWTPRKTLRYFLRRYRFRFGVPIGVLLSMGLLFYGSNIVMQIEIIGNSNATNAEILAILAEQGVKRGSWIPKIDFTACEHKLRADVEELSWVGIRHTGNCLVVEVTEATPEPEMSETRVSCNIVASQNAEIVSLSVYTGYTMHLVGDYVRKGDLLVSGVVMDETGHLSIRHATGSVTGIYTQVQTFHCDYVQEVRTATGVSTMRKYLDLFTWHIPLGSTENPYEDSIQTENYCWFSLFGKELPIGIYRKTFQEYRIHTITFTLEEVEQNLTEQQQ
ncbi:MAG: sporulation protein YqfD [Ruminococcus sp.]|nr:sporulation protein YqfD [Ruminococcus sp.]